MPEFLRDPKFWWSVYGLIVAILTYFVPNIPKEIMAAVEALVSVILAGLTVNSARKRAELRKSLLKNKR